MKIICSECKKEIEDTCKQCPNCGFKNKLNTELYLKTSDINHCSKCGTKINKGEVYCTKCGNKNKTYENKKIIDLIKTIYKRNKKIIIIGILILITLLFVIIDNTNFNRDIQKAEEYYNNGDYYKISEIVDKYPAHSNNEFIKKYKFVRYLLTDYSMADVDSKYQKEEKKLYWLFSGYNDCLHKETTNEQEEDWVKEIKNQYYRGINGIVSLTTKEIEEICVLTGDELENKISSLLKDVKKSKACEKTNVKVDTYSTSGYYIDVTLKNNNGCSWNIKSYSKVRVYFSDNSYEDVYLSTNVNLGAGETYKFSKCYLGSKNEYKSVSSVVCID